MDYNNIPIEKFRFAGEDRKKGDKKFDTKPVSYAKDVFLRFCKNKSSVVAASIIVFLLLFSLLVPIFCTTTYSSNLTDTKYLQFTKLLPKCDLFKDAGFWDGCYDITVSKAEYLNMHAIEEETGVKVITKVYKADYVDTSSTSKTTFYDLRVDSYYKNGMTFLNLTKEEFESMQKWQDETGIQVIYPAVDETKIKNTSKKTDPNVWFVTDEKGNSVLDASGGYQNIYRTSGPEDGYQSLRIEGDDGSYRYAKIGGSGENLTYTVRVLLYNYFQYRYGEEPSFLFGTNAKGQDLLTRIAAGAQFSLILAICISAINLFLGAIIGAVEGYYGGWIDLAVERIIDILGGVPSMVVMSLFQLHLASKVGPVWSMAFAFILTGWIGMSARTRMQFYRFKNQEYVLAARTLGAKDGRLMFKHIFPNAMGTIITGSVLSIPGVIFSESSLTYLGIVNLESSTSTSLGTLLSKGNDVLATHPHIVLFPALFISLLMISFNLFGNGLRDAFNPSLKGIED